MRKPVFGGVRQARLKPACSAIGANKNLEISDIELTCIVLSMLWITKALNRLRGYPISSFEEKKIPFFRNNFTYLVLSLIYKVKKYKKGLSIGLFYFLIGA